MKNLTLTLFALLFATSAFAQGGPPAPAGNKYTIDADGDTFGDATAGAATITAAAKPVGYADNADDCDDSNAQINPKAKELLDDNVDNDCDGKKLESPPAGVLRAFGCSASNHGAVIRLIRELDRCNGSANCKVNGTAGKFETKSGFYFLDKDCDGLREVVDQTEKDRLDELDKRGARCKAAPLAPSRHGTSPCKGTGCRKGTGSKAPAVVPNVKLTELETKVTDLSGKVTATDGKVAELDGRVEGVETVLADNANAIEGIGKVIEGHGKRLDTLEKRADDTDGELTDVRGKIADTDGRAIAATDKADRAYGTARVALSTGVSAGVNVGVGVKPQADVPLRKGVARGSVATVLLVTGHVGAELPSGTYRIGGGVGIPYETGPNGDMESGLLWTVDAKALWKLAPSSQHSLGFVVRYLDQESGGDLLGAHAVSRGGGGGIAYEFSPGPDGSWLRFPIQVTLEGGGESIGSKGGSGSSAFKALDTQGYGLLTLTFGAGVGPALR